MSDNTLLLRLAGPMQSWGTSSRLQIRRTDGFPSKSGVLGLLLCAKGVSRTDSGEELRALAALAMGVRVDRPGVADWDYHTVGGGHGRGAERACGIRSADGKIKRTQKTGEFETLLSRREYLYDASFLVALQGDPATVADCADALADPVWPVFLGRKCCVPAEPVLGGTGGFASLKDALGSVPWRPGAAAVDGRYAKGTRVLDCLIEHSAPGPAPADARLVYDLPRGFGYYNHLPRWVVPAQVTVEVGEPLVPTRRRPPRADPYGPGWDDLKRARREFDHGLCVFCKSPAEEVHHLDYADVRIETLRSLCRLCHEACTSLEYGNDMRRRRIDPSDPQQRGRILDQIGHLLRKPDEGRRRELLEQGRGMSARFFEDASSQ